VYSRLCDYTLYYSVGHAHSSISRGVAVIATATMVGTTESGALFPAVSCSSLLDHAPVSITPDCLRFQFVS
jgi:hypothetical protein